MNEAGAWLADTRMTDEAAVAATAHDYYEGWYDADVARMRRALHPELAKRFLEDAAAMYHEYLQLVRTDQGWQIVNVLWQRR